MNLTMTIFAKDYDPDTFFKIFKENIGKHPAFTAESYAALSLDYRRTMLAERAGNATLATPKIASTRPQIGGHRVTGPQPQPQGIRPIQVSSENGLAMIGLMTCPTGLFHMVDYERFNTLERFIDMGNQGKKMDLFKIYWCSNKYIYNWARTLLRSQRKGRTTASQVSEWLDSAIKTRATNLYGWINGAFADFRQEDPPNGYLDDPADHPSAIDF